MKNGHPFTATVTKLDMRAQRRKLEFVNICESYERRKTSCSPHDSRTPLGTHNLFKKI